MIVLKRFFPRNLFIFTVYNRGANFVTMYFANPKNAFRMILPEYSLIQMKNIFDQLQCHLQSIKIESAGDIFFAKTFFKVMLNRIYYQNYSGLKTIGVGYQFIISKESNYLFISAGLSHLLAHRLSYNTKIFTIKKKKRLLILNSYKHDTLFDECKFIRELRTPDIYCGKGLRLFHEVYKLKEGKKQIR